MGINSSYGIIFGAKDFCDVVESFCEILSPEDRKRFSGAKPWKPSHSKKTGDSISHYGIEGIMADDNDSDEVYLLSLRIPQGSERRSEEYLGYFYTSITVGERYGELSFMSPTTDISFEIAELPWRRMFLSVLASCSEAIFLDMESNYIDFIYPFNKRCQRPSEYGSYIEEEEGDYVIADEYAERILKCVAST